MEIANEELIFFGRGGSNNYRQLMSQKADEYGGQAFITEYAAPTRELVVAHPLLQGLSRRYAYLKRLNTVISSGELTVDPVFDYDGQLKDVSNIRDLSDMKGVFQCDRSARASGPADIGSERSAISLSQSGGAQATTQPAGAVEPAADSTESSLSVGTLVIGIGIGGGGVLAVMALVYLGVVLRRHREG